MDETGEIGGKTGSTEGDAEKGQRVFRGELMGALKDKAKEYAERIMAGEDPISMNVPPPLRAEVQGLVDELRATNSATGDTSNTLDFGDTKEEIALKKEIARQSMGTSAQDGQLDFGTTSEQIEAQKAAVRRAIASTAPTKPNPALVRK